MLKKINNYHILSKIASGGMSEVYLASDTQSGKKVALKILDAKLSIDPEYLYRFKKEASICQQLDHKNIVKILSYGTYKDNYYIAYEYIEGITLDKFVKQKDLTTGQIEDISIQILEGLSYAHSKNIIHRDIKPSNIIIENNVVKILDFGIAKQELAATVTKTGLFMGSPHYVSPEQIEGHDIDYRSDIYSFGIVLYEMAQGSVPFSADTPWGIIRAHLDKKAPEITKDTPLYLKEVVFKCLSKRKEDRFKSANEIISAIAGKEEIGKQTVIIDRAKVSLYEKPVYKDKPKKRLPVKKILAIVLPIIFIAVFIYLFLAIGLPLILIPNAVNTDAQNLENASLKNLRVVEIIAPKTDVVQGETIELSVILETDNQDINYKWLAAKGTFSNENSNLTNWTAPSISGTYSISITVSDNYGNSDIRMIAIDVINEVIAEVTAKTTEETIKTTSTTSNDSEKIRKQDLAEEKFFDNVSSLLDEYNSAFNHMGTYHKEGWIFNDPNEIALEETFLTKLLELSNKLEGFSFPSSLSEERGNLVNISRQICEIENLMINSMKNDDYEGCVSYFNNFWDTVDKFFNTYNSMIDKHNSKYH